jgi:putative spermidine/putrescine transport system substrate-binding protein
MLWDASPNTSNEANMDRNRSGVAANRRQVLKLGAGFGAAALAAPLGAGRSHAADAAMSDAAVMAAKAEGGLNTIALPPDWANYGEIISTFEKKFGIKIENASPDASSAQELQAVRSLKGQMRGPDVLDIGPSFALIGASEGLFTPYKVSTWQTIPDEMNGDYFGLVSAAVNRSVVKTAPTSWADLKKPEYKGMIALNGSPTGAAAAFAAVFAASLANGGSLDDIGPGIAFFGELAKSGNFTPVSVNTATITSGQTPIALNWDYLNLAVAEKAKGMTQIDTVILEGAAAFGNYYCQAISKFSPHPKSAELWQEFLYSDEGQILLLKGFAHPARFADMVSRDVIPADLLAALPPAAPYKTVKFPNAEQTKKAQAAVAEQWSKMVRT